MPSPSIAPTAVPSGYVAITTLPDVTPSADNAACMGVGFGDAFLRGDRTAAEPVWIELASGLGGNARRSVTWPAGFRARFTPRLELLDASGRIVAREGDLLTRLGGYPNDDLHWVVTEINGRSYPCY
jgi:hypothetical protein